MNSHRHLNSGFTLTELLVVITIVGILTMVAIPSFTALSESQRAKNASFEMYALLSIARSEAIKRNTNIKIEPVMVGGVFDHLEVTIVSDGTLLHSKPAPKKIGIEALKANGTTLANVIYTRTGRTTADGAGATFEIDVAGASTPTEYVRCITLGLSGMPQTRKGAC